MLATLESSLDPNRAIAMVAMAAMVVGSQGDIVVAGRCSDLVDYLIARRDEPCGRA